MNRKIKLALFIRIAVLLIGLGLYYLLTKLIKIQMQNGITVSESVNNGVTSRRLLNVKDQFEAVEKKSFDNTTDSDFERVEKTFLHIVFQSFLECYIFWTIAVICDEYFIGSIEILCQKLHLKEDIAGATFLSIATSAPELIISCVATFITEGNIGVGTIVGSTVFNVLAVPAICGLLTITIIHLDWWSVTRECIFYCFSVFAFIFVTYDQRIMWYEAAFLVVSYGIYLLFVYKNDYLMEKAKIMAQDVNRRDQQPQSITEITPLFIRTKVPNEKSELSEPFVKFTESNDKDGVMNPWKLPEKIHLPIFLLRWPITFALWCTIPDCKRFRTFYILTFINCVLWIGLCSSFIVHLSTDVNSVMGLTFLAVGTSIPEAVSSVIVTAEGHAQLGVSNSIGSNTFDILLGLGLPWLIKTLMAPTNPGQTWIALESTGIPHSSFSLLMTLLALYITMIFNKFTLDRKTGVVCLTFYLLFLVFSSFAESNSFLPNNIQHSRKFH